MSGSTQLLCRPSGSNTSRLCLGDFARFLRCRTLHCLLSTCKRCTKVGQFRRFGKRHCVLPLMLGLTSCGWKRRCKSSRAEMVIVRTEYYSVTVVYKLGHLIIQNVFIPVTCTHPFSIMQIEDFQFPKYLESCYSALHLCPSIK